MTFSLAGGYGAVYKAKHKITGKFRAVKKIIKKKMSQHQQELLRNEVEILKSLDHPNILQLYEFSETEEFFFISTELCEGGELLDRIIESKGFAEH